MKEITSIDSIISSLKDFWGRDSITPSEASKVQLILVVLLIDTTVDINSLKFLSRYLTQQAYDEIVEEKNISHECGYLLCDNSPRHSVRRMSRSGPHPGTNVISTTEYQINNRKPSMILPNTYLSQYCCKEHYKASLFYRNQLTNESIFVRREIFKAAPFPQDHPSYWYENGVKCLEEVLEVQRSIKNEQKTLAEVIAMMNGLSVHQDLSINEETKKLIELIEDFEIVEREGQLEPYNEFQDEEGPCEGNDDAIDLASAIEGYKTTRSKFGYVV